MKHLLFLLPALLFIQAASAQTAQKRDSLPDPSRPLLEAEAACGQCQFKLPGSGCDLAIRWQGKAYFVDGSGIDDHGDAHAQEGFCNAVRPARVQGVIKEGRFAATYFKVLPLPEAKKKILQ